MRFFSNPHKPMILALARPDPKKNITTLLKAFGECAPLRELANLVFPPSQKKNGGKNSLSLFHYFSFDSKPMKDHLKWVAIFFCLLKRITLTTHFISPNFLHHPTHTICIKTLFSSKALCRTKIFFSKVVRKPKILCVMNRH
jgi:hypothetical protein